MAKPTTTGKDYGHKLYMNTTAYPEAIGRPTDKQYDNRRKRPHSDDKKPYMEDEYPEMEHYWTPYDPPNLVPPGMPDDPRIPPNRPDNPSTGGDDDPDEDHDFTGCLFSWNAGPSQIKVGETSWHSIDVGNDDPLVRLYVNYGPVALLSSSAKGVMDCINGIYPTCFVRVIAIDFDPAQETEHGSWDDSYLAQIVGVTAAGFTCTWDLTVTYCPPTVEFEYDFDNSAETIARNETTGIFVTGGAGPFKWVVSGNGYTLQKSKTSSRSNILIADGDSCGAAIITVTDACDNEVTGSVRNTTGHWEEKYGIGCGLVAAADWGIDCRGAVEYHWAIWATATVGYQKQYHEETLSIYALAQGLSDTQGECEAERLQNCGAWTNPCLPYLSSWALTSDNCDRSVNWKGTYDECPGYWAHGQCIQPYGWGSWYYIRAGHIQPELRYWEWECN